MTTTLVRDPRPGGAERRWGRALLACALLGAGCAVGPDYVKPEPAAPAAWSSAPAGTSPAPAPDLARWWTVFGDPSLDTLVSRVLTANLDLRLAQARFREARAARGVVASGEWPRVEAQGGARRLRDNKPPAPPEGAVGSWFQAGFDAGWELDVFGGVRRAVEAADADAAAAREETRAVLVSVLGETVRNYAEVRGLQRQLSLARQTADAERETLAVTEARLRAGLASEFDVDRARAQVAVLDARVPALEADLGATVHRLGVLAGEGPAALLGALGPEGPIPEPRADVAVGFPSELLSRRPDLRRAERELAAATARVGVATSDLYPRFSLTGSFGFQSGHFQDFADWSARVWSVGPALRWPVFDAWRVRANVQAQDARREQARLRYERALLLALEEVENALLAYGKEAERRRSLRQAAEAGAQAARTAAALYASGLGDFLQVLDAQRSLYGAQAQLAATEAASAAHLVALYKALGGGWESRPEGAPGAGTAP